MLQLIINLFRCHPFQQTDFELEFLVNNKKTVIQGTLYTWMMNPKVSRGEHIIGIPNDDNHDFLHKNCKRGRLRGHEYQSNPPLHLLFFFFSCGGGVDVVAG